MFYKCLMNVLAESQAQAINPQIQEHIPTRILIVTHYYPEHRGGIELTANELAIRIANRGLEIIWAASDEGAVPSEVTIARLPMDTWNFTERWLGFAYPLWSVRSLARLWRAMRNSHVIHLHDSLYMGNAFAYLFARFLRKPIVVTQHVGMVPYSQLILRGILALANHSIGRAVLEGCDQSIFISKKVQNYFAMFVHFRTPSRYISNGVMTESFQPLEYYSRQRMRIQLALPGDKPIMLFVGRFVERKGLQVLRSLVELFPECLWVFVGWGPLDPSKWNLPNICCPGPLDRIRLIPYFQSADLLVLPSIGEGFPAVVQQAMACGTPALVSDDTARGMPEIMPLLYVSDVAIVTFAAKLRQILASWAELDGRRDDVANFAHSHWDWEMCADEYYKIFTALTS
jgi:glycosyltransferase involved in cell wall biosynthesis